MAAFTHLSLKPITDDNSFLTYARLYAVLKNIQSRGINQHVPLSFEESPNYNAWLFMNELGNTNFDDYIRLFHDSNFLTETMKFLDEAMVTDLKAFQPPDYDPEYRPSKELWDCLDSQTLTLKVRLDLQDPKLVFATEKFFLLPETGEWQRLFLNYSLKYYTALTTHILSPEYQLIAMLRSGRIDLADEIKTKISGIYLGHVREAAIESGDVSVLEYVESRFDVNDRQVMILSRHKWEDAVFASCSQSMIEHFHHDFHGLSIRDIINILAKVAATGDLAIFDYVYAKIEPTLIKKKISPMTTFDSDFKSLISNAYFSGNPEMIARISLMLDDYKIRPAKFEEFAKIGLLRRGIYQDLGRNLDIRDPRVPDYQIMKGIMSSGNTRLYLYHHVAKGYDIVLAIHWALEFGNLTLAKMLHQIEKLSPGVLRPSSAKGWNEARVLIDKWLAES